MNRRQFIILLVVVAAVGAAGWIVHQRNSNSWQGSETGIGRKLLPELAINDITQITIQSGTNVLMLVRWGNWRVADRGLYPANFSQISELLLKLAALKIVQSEQIGPSQLGRFELLPPGSEKNSGTQVQLSNQKGKVLATLLLGKKHMTKRAGNSQPGGLGGDGWPDGRYVIVGTAPQNVDLISDPLESLQPHPAPWLNRDFFSIENPRTIEARFADTTNSWKLIRASETNDWQLADTKAGEALDLSKISGVTRLFSSVNFNDVSPLKSDSATNATVLTVETFDGFTYVANISPQQDDIYPVNFSINASLPAERAATPDEKPDDKIKLDQAFKEQHDRLAKKLAGEKQFENWVYFLPSYSLDEMLKQRGQLLTETNAATATEPTK